MDSLISKKVLTKDKVDILLENYGHEINNRGDSTYFKVQTITVNEDTLSLLNENYNYKVIKDYEPSIVENLEEEELDDAKEMIKKVKDKIKKYRTSGLEKEGEYSYENLTFKALRRNGYLQKLFDFENDLMDKRLSLEEGELF